MPGEIVALLGPNGSGKSTLIRTISGELPPLAGRVQLSGKSISSLSHVEIARCVAMAPQEETHQFGFTVLEVATMGRHACSNTFFDSEEDKRLAREALQLTDCLDLADRRITEISGGEKQRVLIARALVQQAPLLLLDEPTSHLDVAHQIAFARIIREVAGQGKGILAAVHDLNLASLLASRGILLSGGIIRADLPMQDLAMSKELDAAYGVEFQRVNAGDGKLRLYTKL
jgi:iron complex transport system ATP-binding protein